MGITEQGVALLEGAFLDLHHCWEYIQKSLEVIALPGNL